MADNCLYGDVRPFRKGRDLAVDETAARDGRIKILDQREYASMREFSPAWRAAKAAVAAGEIVLHVYKPPSRGWPGAPAVFNREALAGRPWAHLMAHDRAKLESLARQFGVRRVVVHGQGERMHVDLCGKPLERAIAEAAKVADGVEPGE